MGDQDATHHHRCQPDDVRAIPPVDAVLLNEPEIGLVHERGRLQRVIAALTPHVRGRDPMQLIVDEGQDGI